MRTTIILALAYLAVSQGVFAQVYTAPAGYVNLGDTTAGQPAVKANTDVWISIPLNKPSIFGGTISSVSTNVITLTGTPALTNLTTVPHTLTITSGTGKGLIALITANTANTVTISVPAGDSLAGVASPDSVSINPAWTVLGFLGNTMPVGVTLYTYLPASALNASADGVYEWNGSNWIDNVNTGDPANNDVLYPGETLVLRNPTNTPITTFVVSGEVPMANSRLVVGANGAAGGDKAISFFSPVNQTIGSSGLAAFAQTGDIIYGFDNNSSGINKSASSVHEFVNGNWIDQVNTGDPDNTFPLGAGKGFIFRRPGTRTQVVWNSPQAYLPQ
ncbi:MAG: TIGR02597 family protein [Akkermansiaceae bacterium]